MLKRMHDHLVEVCAVTDLAVIFQRSYLTSIFSTMDALVTAEGKWQEAGYQPASELKFRGLTAPIQMA